VLEAAVRRGGCRRQHFVTNPSAIYVQFRCAALIADQLPNWSTLGLGTFSDLFAVILVPLGIRTTTVCSFNVSG
jgi:hypothetical protein